MEDAAFAQGRGLATAREPASARTLESHRSKDARLRGYNRGSDGVDATLDREAGVLFAEQGREPVLYRAALPRRQLWSARIAARPARGRGRFCARTRSRSRDQG